VTVHPVANAPVGDRLRAMLFLQQGEELSSAYGSRVTFSLRGQRESNQRERPPRLALAGLPARQVREPGPGFSTGLLSGRKGIDIPVDARCAACRPRLTAAQGPRVEQRAILARTRWEAEKLKSRSSKAMLCYCALDLALLKSARRERAALPGAPMARRVGGGKPAGWPAWMPASFSPAQDVLSKNPVAHPRTRRAGCPQGAPSGWPLFWLLFSGYPEKSDSPSEGGRKLFALKASCIAERKLFAAPSASCIAGAAS
jgi:hypothetical protein